MKCKVGSPALPYNRLVCIRNTLFFGPFNQKIEILSSVDSALFYKSKAHSPPPPHAFGENDFGRVLKMFRFLMVGSHLCSLWPMREPPKPIKLRFWRMFCINLATMMTEVNASNLDPSLPIDAVVYVLTNELAVRGSGDVIPPIK